MNRLRFTLPMLLSTALLAGCTQTAREAQTRVPSDPARWGRLELGLPDATPACPGGEIAALRAQVPQLEPQTVAAYARTHPGHLDALRGVQATDAVYPFAFESSDFRNPDAASPGFAQRGFFLVRGACLIHVGITSFDN